ncbi:MAG: TrkH family potassium uptake protein [Deltaproteobacteria bacterium]|nr:TrkH family potassium uptake protein [Deltaproteobacteria bacterium]
MRLRPVLYILGAINLCIALAMVAPLIVSLIYHDGEAHAFLKAIIASGVVGAALFFLFRGGKVDVGHREGFLIVTLAWLDICLFGALPYLFSGVFSTFVNAYFESVSGFTTTGASVLTHIADLPRGILFWRSMTQWLGGMGIILLSLAILPLLGIGGMQLYKAEASVVTADKFVPRITEMAKILWLAYLIMSVFLLAALKLSGMNLFDSFVHTFATISTGGFSNQNSSIEYYGSPLIESILMIFMFLGATSFALHYRCYREGFKVYSKNGEFRLYVLLLLVSACIVIVNMGYNHYESFALSIRHALFQVVSVMTTTGYSSADFVNWPPLSKAVLLLLMFLGGTAGSTTGAIKCIRILVLFKLGYREIVRLVHPHAVFPIKLGGRSIPNEVINGVMGFTFIYLFLFAITSLILAGMNLDIVTAISASAATIGNIGPGLGAVGPASNYSAIPFAGKWLLIFNMLMGRLEIYTLVVLFTPAFWRG